MKDLNAFEVAILGAIVFILVFTCFRIYKYKKHGAEFMSECLQDKKQYECDALWGMALRGR